jgi:hypothetical protein
MEVVFYRSTKNPNLFLLYKGKNGVNAEKMLRKLTNRGEYENSGFPKIEVEIAYLLKTDLDSEFFDFLVEVVSTKHTEHLTYNDDSFKAWYEFKNFEPDIWLKEFQVYNNSRSEEFMKGIQQGTQTTLF